MAGTIVPSGTSKASKVGATPISHPLMSIASGVGLWSSTLQPSSGEVGASTSLMIG